MVSSTNLANVAGVDTLKSLFQDCSRDAGSSAQIENENVKPVKGSSTRQIIAAVIANLGTVNTGLTFGFSAVAIPQLKSPESLMKITTSQESWIASLSAIGTPCGCILSAYLTDWIGRKKTLLLTEVPSITGWIIIALAPSVQWIYIGRILTGFGSGMAGAPSRVYTAEVSQPHLRGVLSALASVGASLGVAVEYLLGALFEWRSIAWISAVIPLVAAATSLFLPESPSWLVTKGKRVKCFDSMKKLRGSTCDVHKEVNALVKFSERDEIPAGAEGDKSKSTTKQKLRVLAHPSVLKPFFILTSYFFIYQMSGTNPITFYSVEIFGDSGTTLDKYLATVLTGVVRLLFTIVGCALMIQCGRRTLTFVSSVGCGLTMIFLGAYIFMVEQWKEDKQVAAATWIPVVSVFLFTAASTVGYLIVPWVMIGELYPTKVRGLVGGFTTSLCHIFIFISVKTYPLLRDGLTPYAPFWIYGSVSLLGTVFFFMYLPETKGKTLQQIEDGFSSPKERQVFLQRSQRPIVVKTVNKILNGNSEEMV